MNILDIIGPVMVGPSSSHTAGAVRIGLAGRKLMGCEVVYANIYFHGSFLATGKGHGTDRALIAGLLGYAVDDERIPDSFRLAKERGLDYKMQGINLGDDAHPNSVKMNLTGVNGRELEIIASSIGGGRIQIDEIDGLLVRVSGDYPTLIVHNQDQPGHVTEVTSMLAHKSINIATMQLYRSSRGGEAVMVIECDQEIPQESIRWLEHLEGICKVTYLNMNHTKEAAAFSKDNIEMKAKTSVKAKILPDQYQGKQGM
jgi:L-serine dehydratase